jgi:hypothetical protein
MTDIRKRILKGLIKGLKGGWSGFAWMCRIVIPLSFLISLLQWTGWLNYLDFLLEPLTRLIHLPPEAALPILAGMLINLYACIAVITVVPFTTGQMTLIAVFSLICHNIITEAIIQHKAGINAAKIIIIRFVAAVIAVLIVSLFMGDTGQSVVLPAGLAVRGTLFEAVTGWASGTLALIFKIFGIIMGLMIILGLLRALGWIEPLLRFFRPVMRAQGLPERTAMMFMAAVIFGLAYGSAVIVEEARQGKYTREELEYLHISIGINHSIVEDPALFVILGLNAFWMWVPKLVMAVAAVQGYRLILYLKKKLLPPRPAITD